MTIERTLEAEARAAADSHAWGKYRHNPNAIGNDDRARVELRDEARKSYREGYLAAAEPREKEIAELRVVLERCRKAVDAYIKDEEDNVKEIDSLRAELDSHKACTRDLKAEEVRNISEIASLRARVAELEGMVPKWVPDGHPMNDLFNAGWSPSLQDKSGPGKMVLMVPPIPAPEERS